MSKEQKVDSGLSSQNIGKPNVSSRFITITYLIYIALWEGLTIGGCAYIVFGLGYSGWWFVLAVVLSGSAYSPEKWKSLLNGC